MIAELLLSLYQGRDKSFSFFFFFFPLIRLCAKEDLGH